jgi:hypothetical protein
VLVDPLVPTLRISRYLYASVIGLIAKNNRKGISPDGPFDKPFTARAVHKAVEATGFLK